MHGLKALAGKLYTTPGMEQRTVKTPLKVIPGASRDQIVGWLGDRLKVKVRAPAESGKANRAVTTLVAAKLGLPLHAVRIVSGGASPRKLLELDGLSEVQFRKRIENSTP